MNKIIQYFKRRRVRKLAERLLASQTLYSDYAIQRDRISCAIQTAQKFYDTWEKRK